ncbi:hypothetical protein MHI22_18200 [Lysinibacillus sp. FSL L8-0312]|uniref:hypothetical protein n=1 Tax=Lysinibacillus sp. FSL L8-0312 TaxID=2921521 RepID=UPI0030FBF587
MTIYSGIFNSVNGDRKYNAWWFAKYFATFIGNGVFPNPSSNLQVAAYQNMKVVVKPGSGWIDGYFIFSDGDHVLSLDVADGVLKRIDRVVMRLNHLTRKIEIVVKKGTFASNPVAPTLQRDADAYELALADVLVNNGATQITQANITDQRLNSTLCGIVHGTVNQVDTTTIFNQYQAWFNDIKGSIAGELDIWQDAQEQEFLIWFDSIKDILDGDVAGNLASRIASLEQGLDNHIADVSHIKWIETIGGTANVLTATIDGLTSYKNGLAVSFPVNSNSTAAMTLNINGLGAIPIKNSNGIAVSNLKANGVYTVRYRAGAFILQGEGGSGNAVANDIRKGKTATVDNGDITGTLDLSQLIPGNIKNGVTIDGVTGNLIGSPTPSVGDAAVVASVGYTVQYTSDFKKIKEIICNFSGRVRITFDLYGSGTGKGYEHVYGQIYINGIPKGVIRNNNNSSGTFYSEDFDINNGDRVQLYAHGRTNPDTWATSDVLAICFASNPLGTVVQV